MSRTERTGERDLTYSHWHRGHWEDGPSGFSVYRDIDGLEYCNSCGEPLLLVETASANGDRLKDHKAMLTLAKKADVPAVLIFYETATGRWCERCGQSFKTVGGLFVRYVWPERTTEHKYTPAEWAEQIDAVHQQHNCHV